ncbi:hypothetical protein EV122DRAFT_210512 [Schizophyllum commune]
MSSPPPLSPNAASDVTSTTEPLSPLGANANYPTRTVAIIKNHALAHRFDIEPRIQEAKFEIVKERQMEFDVETDPETLYELFGDDADSLGEGPVWVYVLERRRAVEVWNTLMGPADPDVAREECPNSLRALFGISAAQNGLMGSPDVETAEVQIASLFASSPPFPTSELPDDAYGSIRSLNSTTLRQLRHQTADEGYAPSSNADGSRRTSISSGTKQFRARGLPPTHDKPDIVPRMSRAAALRAGIAVDKVDTRPRAPLSKERLAQTFENVPGHKRSSTIHVASTAAPAVAPRMTKAAALRLGIKLPEKEKPVERRPAVEENRRKTFDGVPGHKRRETINVASTGTPTVAPRLNRSAMLRAQKKEGGAAPPSSFSFRSPSTSVSRAPSRSSSQNSMRPPSAQGGARPLSATPRAGGLTRSASMSSRPTASGMELSRSTSSAVSSPPTPAKPKPRPSSISAPTIAPRTNKSAALRAAKQEAEKQAAAKKTVRRASMTPRSVAA